MIGLAVAAPQWRTIPQPAALQALVVVAGLAMIAAELWWFLGRHGGGVMASDGEQGMQEITITVEGGYAPSRIRVKAGRPVRLRFHRPIPAAAWPR